MSFFWDRELGGLPCPLEVPNPTRGGNAECVWGGCVPDAHRTERKALRSPQLSLKAGVVMHNCIMYVRGWILIPTFLDFQPSPVSPSPILDPSKRKKEQAANAIMNNMILFRILI